MSQFIRGLTAELPPHASAPVAAAETASEFVRRVLADALIPPHSRQQCVEYLEKEQFLTLDVLASASLKDWPNFPNPPFTGGVKIALASSLAPASNLRVLAQPAPETITVRPSELPPETLTKVLIRRAWRPVQVARLNQLLPNVPAEPNGEVLAHAGRICERLREQLSITEREALMYRPTQLALKELSQLAATEKELDLWITSTQVGDLDRMYPDLCLLVAEFLRLAGGKDPPWDVTLLPIEMKKRDLRLKDATIDTTSMPGTQWRGLAATAVPPPPVPTPAATSLAPPPAATRPPQLARTLLLCTVRLDMS
jgi:hypothetical protein